MRKKISEQKIKNKKTFDKYYNYPAEVVLKRVLKYAWKSRMLIILSLLFLIGYTYLELLQPKLINTVLDDHLLGVQTVWEKVDDGSVSYNGNKYEKVSKEHLDQSSEVISILYLDGKYFVSNGMYLSLIHI
mgnify:CR=1 FL=1